MGYYKNISNMRMRILYLSSLIEKGNDDIDDWNEVHSLIRQYKSPNSWGEKEKGKLQRRLQRILQNENDENYSVIVRGE